MKARAVHRIVLPLLRARPPLALLAFLACAIAGGSAGAQESGRAAPCTARVSNGPTFVFGNEAGTLHPRTIKLWADGSMRVGASARTAPDSILADSVRTLARDAHRSAFWTTVAPPITRPTRNPDVTREYIDALLSCGHRHSLYPADEEPVAFRELLRRLHAIAGLAGVR
jgi:hypothetical protein